MQPPLLLPSVFHPDAGLYSLFDEVALNIADAARLLRDTLRGADGIRRIRRCERRGDDLTEALGSFARRAVAVPFDRQDIWNLGRRLNTVVADIVAVSELVVLYELTEPVPEVGELADLLMKSAEANVSLIAKFRVMRGFDPELEVIDRLGSEADHVYRRSVARLSDAAFDAIEVLKARHIVRAAASAVVGIEASSRIVRSVRIKHA